MSYRYTNQNREEYLLDGFTVLRGLIPASLLADLRLETDKARVIAREQNGPQTQRLQPVYAYPELRHECFRDFLNLPEFVKTVYGILGDDHPQSEIMGVLLEPAGKPWATNWHRDWMHHNAKIDPVEFSKLMRNPLMFNQFNAALWDDHSLWVVPGSHDRDDTPEEIAAFGQVPVPPPSFKDHQSNEERELICGEYLRQMPGAHQVSLLAGDCAFYRSCQWHIGTYVPYTKRATLHDGFYGPDDLAWQAKIKGA